MGALPHVAKENEFMATNYYVLNVRYNSDQSHIDRLRVAPVQADKSFNPAALQELSRPQAIDLINKGSKFTTLVKKADKEWLVGAELQILSVATDYLKTKNDKSTRDNLENLPTF